MMKKKCAESSKRNGGNINDILCYELLVKIFMALNIVDLATVSLVCKTWLEARSDPQLWHKLDLTALCCKPIYMPRMIGSMNRKESGEKISKVFREVLAQSEGHHIRCFVFNFYAYLREEHLLFVAQRTPNLKRLVLPAICLLSKEAIENAMRLWGGLESITITRMINHNDIFPAIGKYCKRITELKFTSGFEMSHARALIEHTPNLKFLSIQSIIVNFTALCSILKSLKHLEIVNMCHSLIMDKKETLTNQIVMYTFSELEDHLPVQHYRKILFCESRVCVICKNKMAQDFLTKKPYEIFEDLWRQDEIKSLAH